MKIYNRGKYLYVRDGDNRQSTGLEDNSKNRKFLENQLKHDKFFKNFNINTNVPTVIELCEEVLDDKEESLKPTSLRSYRSILNSRIIPYFNKMLIADFDALEVEKWYKTFEDKSTLITAESIVRKAIEKAIIRKYIDHSPLIVGKPTLRSKYKITPFAISEFKLLLDSCKTEWFKNFIGVSLYTGMRTGELLGLKWKDIDFDNYVIQIRRTITKGFVQRPKTNESERDIDMLHQCETFLHNQRKITGLSEFVFLNYQNKHFYDSTSLNPIWKKVLRKADLEYRGIYQMRHSFASNMLSNGEELLWVSAMLGHKNPGITLQRYSRFVRKKRERKITFLDDFGSKMAH